MTPFAPKKRGIDLRHQVAIIVPSDEGYTPAATKIATALEMAGCHEVRIAGASDKQSELGNAIPIAIGNFSNNYLIQTLYYTGRDVTDSGWPGTGGWAIRCVANATITGADAVLLSISGDDDAMSAAADFGQILEKHGLNLPWLHQVKLGRYSQRYLDQINDHLPTDETSLDIIGGGSGDWDYMLAIGKVGMLAVKTGNEKLILRFASEILRFIRVRFSERKSEDPMQIHGFLRNLLRPFAMLEHHPVLSDSLRMEVLQVLLTIYRSTEGVAHPNFLDDIRHTRIRQNHQTRTALDAYDGGLYFWRQHGLEEGKQWMQLAEQFFEPQLKSSKPICDSWGHQWNGSLYNTAEYALLSGKFDYFTSSHFIDAADRALMAHTNLETGPFFYLLLAATVTGNAEYLALCHRKGSPLPGISPVNEIDLVEGKAELEDRLIQRALMQLGGDEFGRTWISSSISQAPARLTGVKVAPLARLFYDTIESYEPYAPPGVYRKNVPFDATFDKISYRSGWDEQDTYLLLDGISGGSHSHQDANCLVRFTSHGKSWLGGPKYARWTTGTVRELDGLNISCNGEGAGCEARYARLNQAETIAEIGLIHTSLDIPSIANWHRQIIIHPQGWILVCDEVVASKEGEFSLQAQWNLLGDVTPIDDDLHGVKSIQNSAFLTLRQAGCDSDWLSPIHAAEEQVCMRWNLRRSQQLAPGESTLIATLLSPTTTSEGKTPTLDIQDQTLSVKGGTYSGVTIQLDHNIDKAKVSEKSIYLVAAGKLKTEKGQTHPINSQEYRPSWCHNLDSPVSSIETGTVFCIVGTKAGDIFRLNPKGIIEDKVSLREEISSIKTTEDGGMLIGCMDGTLHRFDSSSHQMWSYTIEWQPMNWDNWTRGNCAILDLAVNDFGGETHIIAGCADRHLYAFNTDGELLWRSPCKWGSAAHVAIAAIGDRQENQVMVGMESPAIHAWCRVYDANGNYLRALERPDIVSWSIPSFVRELKVADIDSDGHPEVIVGMDTNHRQLVIYRGSGEIFWEADVGSTVTCLIPAHNRLYVGTEGGWIHCFDPDGGKLWSKSMDRPIRGLTPLSADRTIMALDDGNICVIDQTTSSYLGTSISSTKSTAYWPGHGLLLGADIGNQITFFQ